jgi:hypothetical protein
MEERKVRERSRGIGIRIGWRKEEKEGKVGKRGKVRGNLRLRGKRGSNVNGGGRIKK